MTDHLTDLEQLLLLAVLRLDPDAWGASIQEDLEESAERRVSLGSIHVTLGRLEERGLVLSAKGEPTVERGGKARRMYVVTEAGRLALNRGREILDRMWAGVPAESGLEP
jgi:PadR family transcriptional regulator PadR